MLNIKNQIDITYVSKKYTIQDYHHIRYIIHNIDTIFNTNAINISLKKNFLDYIGDIRKSYI